MHREGRRCGLVRKCIKYTYIYAYDLLIHLKEFIRHLVIRDDTDTSTDGVSLHRFLKYIDISGI